MIGAIEFCFSIRYPELHGRDTEEPWVIRQLLVYQRHEIKSSSSTWIILQCPLHLRHILASTDVRATLNEDPLMLQMIILNYALKNWRNYVDHLETVIESLVSQNYIQMDDQSRLIPFRHRKHQLTCLSRTKKPASHASAKPINSTIPPRSATPSCYNSTTA